MFEHFDVSWQKRNVCIYKSQAKFKHLKSRIRVFPAENWSKLCHLMSMNVTLWDLRLPKINVFWRKHLFECWFLTFWDPDSCVAPNFKPVKSERSNFTQVLPEFRVPKNSFHKLPWVLKTYFESLAIAF